MRNSHLGATLLESRWFHICNLQGGCWVVQRWGCKGKPKQSKSSLVSWPLIEQNYKCSIKIASGQVQAAPLQSRGASSLLCLPQPLSPHWKIWRLGKNYWISLYLAQIFIFASKIKDYIFFSKARRLNLSSYLKLVRFFSRIIYTFISVLLNASVELDVASESNLLSFLALNLPAVDQVELWGFLLMALKLLDTWLIRVQLNF